eukprot:g80623.t1
MKLKKPTLVQTSKPPALESQLITLRMVEQLLQSRRTPEKVIGSKAARTAAPAQATGGHAVECECKTCRSRNPEHGDGCESSKYSRRNPEHGDGCECSKCRRRNPEHGDGCECSKCRPLSRRNPEHGDGCECSKCSRRNPEHGDGCERSKCSRRNPEHGDGCECSKCRRLHPRHAEECECWVCVPRGRRLARHPLHADLEEWHSSSMYMPQQSREVVAAGEYYQGSSLGGLLGTLRSQSNSFINFLAGMATGR